MGNLLVWSVICALIVKSASGQQSCTSGFISLSNLTTRAPMGMREMGCDTVCERDREQRLIPAISFTCNGTITKWIFGADFDDQNNNDEFPELQLWRLQADSTYTNVESCIPNIAEVDSNRIYECLPDSPLPFEVGDVLGIFQPQVNVARLTVYYDVQGPGHPLNYFDEMVNAAATTFDTSSADSTENALPLVTVEILADCGSLTDPENGRVTLTGTTEGSTANYSCNTGYSLMGVSMRTCHSDGTWSDQPPVCTLVDCGSLNNPENGQVTLTGTTEGSTANYSCNTGHSLMGVSMRTCQSDGMWSDQPPVCTLVTSSPIASSPSSMSEAVSIPGSIATQVIAATTPLNMPQPTTAATDVIQMSTSAVSMVSTTQVPPPVGSLTTTPSLSQLSTPPIAASPTSQASSPPETTMSTPDETVSPTTSSEIEGMIENSQNPSSELPTPTSLSVTPTLQDPTESPPPVSETPTLQDPTEDTADTTSTPQESSTPSAPPLGNTGSSSASAAIAGAVVGGFVAVLLAFTVVVLLLIILRRKKKRRKHEFTTAAGGDTISPIIENPVYSDDMPGKFIGGGTGTEDAAAYNDYDDIAVASSDVYQSVDEQSQHYEEPEKLNLAMENGTRRRNIYNTLSSGATNSELLAAELPYEDAAGASGTFYQWGVYVPSEEERRNFATGDGQTMSEVGENVYAALGEAQFKAGYVSSGPSPAFFEDSNIYWAPSSDKSELYEQLATKKYREIPRHQVQITDNLGEGQFGTVNKGVWQSPAGAKEVAVKTLKSQASEMDAVKFLQEAAINGQFKHPNVVKLFGVVTIGEPVMIVLELLANGDLRHYLNKQQPAPGEMVPSSTPPMLLNFCRQVAGGMEYLARKAFVHRDLAARNILVSEDKTCKVSDFGMSRDLADESYYVSHGGKIPVKWTAPEALHYKKYSTASDVWSFGAVMYEIWSLGHKPFEGHTNAETIKLVDSGYRLPPPPGCPNEIYKWMIRCWHPERHTRPQFSQLSEALNQPDFDLLMWSEEDAKVPQAMVLGAPLEAGKQLYPELQEIYVKKRSPATQIATL